MPPKKKKPLKKSKLKNVVSVKKPRVKPSVKQSVKPSVNPRVELIKAMPQQPFVNFPSYQPTRIQQLEPKYEFSKADLTKTMDEYQKQLKVYMETTDKSVKDLIEKHDDTLKKNTAPSSNQPGASTEFTNSEGETIYSEPVIKTTHNWHNSNSIPQNKMLESKVDNMPSNRLFNRPRTYVNNEEIDEEIDKDIPMIATAVTEIEATSANISDVENLKRELSIQKIYEEYKVAYKQYHENNDYDEFNPRMPASSWSNKRNSILKKIEEYGTYAKQQQVEKSKKAPATAPAPAKKAPATAKKATLAIQDP